MVVYHLPEAVSWVHNGRPGSVVSVLAPLPVGNYALTHEVLLAWGTAIGHSFAWATLVTAAVPALVGVSAWTGLRAVGVARLNAPLSGDRLQHRLTLVEPREACRRAASAHAGLVLDLPSQRAAHVPTCGPPAYTDGQWAVYAPGATALTRR
jgi:hypothetical protein